MSNLISNAVEYIAEGGIIFVRDAQAGGFALEIRDSGPPISQADLPRLFDRFFRANAARSGGLHCGIGLALAKNLCSLLSLTLTASNMTDGSVMFRLADASSQDVQGAARRCSVLASPHSYSRWTDHTGIQRTFGDSRISVGVGLGSVCC